MARKRTSVNLTPEAAAKLQRQYRKIDKNFHVLPPLQMNKDEDHITIWDGSEPKIVFLKFVSGPTSGIYEMQPVEWDTANEDWIEVGETVYMKA